MKRHRRQETTQGARLGVLRGLARGSCSLVSAAARAASEGEARRAKGGGRKRGEEERRMDKEVLKRTKRNDKKYTKNGEKKAKMKTNYHQEMQNP